jgi:hypothetical protein
MHLNVFTMRESNPRPLVEGEYTEYCAKSIVILYCLLFHSFQKEEIVDVHEIDEDCSHKSGVTC